MADARPAPDATPGDARHQQLRRLGAAAHQLRAATRAADHFIALGPQDDRDTGSWLMNAATAMAAELAGDIDGLARSLREAPADAALAQAVQRLRIRTHQLHAATRAADHFLDLDTPDDQDTGSWLIATARSLAERLAADFDDAAGAAAAARRGAAGGAAETVVDDEAAALQRRLGQATATVRPVRGVR